MTESAYRQHLSSPRWKEIKSDAEARSLGLCELCKAAAAETHHIKYPRGGYSTDSADNVLHVCSSCHRRLHGMHTLISDRSLTEIQITTFKDRPASVWIDERRWVWAPIETWANVLLVPAPMRPRLFADIGRIARAQQKEHGEPFELPDAKGGQWFRWHAIDDGFAQWYYRARDRANGRDGVTDDERFVMSNWSKVQKWGRDLQERMLAGGQGGAPATANQEALARAMALLAGVTGEHEERLGAHELRIGVVESKVHKNPDDFIDAKSFLIETGRSPELTVAGTAMTVQQWIGMEAKKAGVAVGPRAKTRLEGCSRVTEVNTYRRGDLALIIARLPS